MWQIYLLEYLRSRGCAVWIVNPFETETTAQADLWIKRDVKDVEGIAADLRERGLRPTFVTSDQSDGCTLPMARLCEALGLRGNRPEAVNLFTNKILMYKHAAAHGLPVPPFAAAFTAQDVRDFGGEHGLPIIIKPADATASRGFTKIEDYDGLEEKVAACRHWSKQDYFVVQKFALGREMSVEGFASGYRHKSLVASVKEHFRPGIASSLTYPADSPLLPCIFEANDRFVNKSGLEFGITHAEYMVDGKDFWFVEMGARGGGIGISSDVVPLATGVPLYDLYFRALRGETIDLDTIKPGRRLHVRLQFYEFPEGRVVSMAGVEKFQGLLLPGLHRFRYNFRVNDYLKPATTDSARHSMAIITGRTPEELEWNAQRIAEALDVETRADQ